MLFSLAPNVLTLRKCATPGYELRVHLILQTGHPHDLKVYIPIDQFFEAQAKDMPELAEALVEAAVRETGAAPDQFVRTTLKYSLLPAIIGARDRELGARQ